MLRPLPTINLENDACLIAVVGCCAKSTVESVSVTAKSGVNPMAETQTVSSPALLDAHQAAKLLNVSERTLWSLTSPRGRLPVVRIGRLQRFRLADLQNFIQGQLR